VRYTSEQARQIIDLLEESTAKLREAQELVRLHSDEDTFKKFVIPVSTIAWAIFADLLHPIYTNHPEHIPEDQQDLFQRIEK
jgi:hypothetical protein